MKSVEDLNREARDREARDYQWREIQARYQEAQDRLERSEAGRRFVQRVKAL